MRSLGRPLQFAGWLACLLTTPVPTPAQRELPPVSYVCPMSEHSDVLEHTPGKCPVCQMVLVPVRIDQAYSCPTHPVVIADKPGLCPLDKRALLPVAVSLYWTCPDAPDERLTEPGRCAGGAPRRAVREHRAHGDHNPKHGGQFFMASNKWHHIEATYPRAGRLRVYIYDNFTNPIPVKGLRGRAVTRELFDSSTGKSRELDAVPLAPSRDGRVFDATVSITTLPAKVTLKMTFDPRLAEERFDFVFEDYSREPATPVSQTSTRTPQPASAPRAPAASTPPAAPQPVAVPTSTPPEVRATVAPTARGATEIALAAEPLPATPNGLLDVLSAKHAEIRDLLERGQLGAIYVPALIGKDAALALESHLSQLPSPARAIASAAIQRIVVTAWKLDASGDLGDREQVALGVSAFARAVEQLQSAYAPAR